MSLELIHIYGPISIHWYGLMIFIAIIIATYLLTHDPVANKLISKDQIYDLITICIVAGAIGGRILFLVMNAGEYTTFFQMVAVWDGGFSILGTLIGIIIALMFYVRKNHIDLLKLMDICAAYAPLIQSISRIGCFFAGCCYGVKTVMPWGVVYGPSCCGAPQGILLHPTQLYSAGILLIMFLMLRYVLRPICKKPGQLAMMYLILASGERFIVDFWRGDREFMNIPMLYNILSVHQLLAICLGCVACIMLMALTLRT